MSTLLACEWVEVTAFPVPVINKAGDSGQSARCLELSGEKMPRNAPYTPHGMYVPTKACRVKSTAPGLDNGAVRRSPVKEITKQQQGRVGGPATCCRPPAKP